MLRIIAALLLTAAPVFAQCPPPVSADQRTRIIECTDGTYAVQWYSIGSGEWHEYASARCGLTLSQARKMKQSSIAEDKAADEANCPSQPKYPIVEVE